MSGYTITSQGVEIYSGGTYTVVQPITNGTNIEFLNTAGDSGGLILPNNSIQGEFTVNPTTTNGIYGISLGGRILNFQPSSLDGPNNLGDAITLQVIEGLFDQMDPNPSDQASFAAAVSFAGAPSGFNGELFIVSASGAIDVPNLTGVGVTLNAAETLVLDNIVQAIFGADWGTNNANLYISFADRPDPQKNGQDVTDAFITSNAAINPCFTPGTRILTPTGEVPIENLAPGDLLITHAGEEGELIWIGRRQIQISNHPRPDIVRPVIIEPGAIADNIPARRLTLSPDHALYLDNVLVQAKDLLNGTTIRQDLTCTQITYIHLELTQHDIIFAENTPAESYLDTGHRSLFDNAGPAPIIAHPTLMQVRRTTTSCAPLVTTGPTLATIRQRIARRQVGVRIG